MAGRVRRRSDFKFIGGNNSTEGGRDDLSRPQQQRRSRQQRTHASTGRTQSPSTRPKPPPCFASGTRIATTRGEVAVEDLRVGDLVLTPRAAAKVQPIIWIGHTRVNVAAHPNRTTVAPILVKEGAIAEGVPHRDLRVSPDHAFFIDGRLVPAKHLVNGSSIVQEAWCPQVTYWHVELPEHAVIVSEGAATESYLDDGNRQNFDNGAVASHAVQGFREPSRQWALRRGSLLPAAALGHAVEIIRGRLVPARQNSSAAPARPDEPRRPDMTRAGRGNPARPSTLSVTAGRQPRGISRSASRANREDP